MPQQSRTFPLTPGQDVSGSSTPRGGLGAIFSSKTSEAPRERKKLQKKRVPGSNNQSAQSSQYSLHDAPNPEQAPTATTTTFSAATPTSSQPATPVGFNSPQAPQPQQPMTVSSYLQPPSQDNTPLKPPPPLNADAPMSPANSYRSHSEFTEGELDDVQPLDHQGPGPSDSTRDLGAEQTETGKRRRFWRKKGDSVSYGSHSPSPNAEAQRSRSSILSGERKSLTLDRNATLSDEDGERGLSGRDSNPLLWIKGKIAERKEEKDRVRDEKRRTRSPGAYERGGINMSLASLSAATSAAGAAAAGSTHAGFGEGSRGKSMDVRRGEERVSMDAAREASAPKQSLDHSGAGPRKVDLATPAAVLASAPTATGLSLVPSTIPEVSEEKLVGVEEPVQGGQAKSAAETAALIAAAGAKGPSS